MKTSAQRLERTEITELVPEILHLKKILVPIDFSPMARPKRRTLPRRFPTLATAACAAFGVKLHAYSIAAQLGTLQTSSLDSRITPNYPNY